MPSENLVELREVSRSYGAVSAVDRLSFAVRRGEMFGLIGPDGAGKTTTLRMVCGLLPPTLGSIRTCGLDPYRQARALSTRIGYLAQRFSLYGDLSIDENIAFFAEIHGVRDWKQRREELLARVGLAPFRARLADKLSGGMRQKLGLAATLIHVPELLVLDEATSGVDPVSRREFWKILTGLVAEGLTVLLSTPYIDEAERCHRVALVHRGTLLRLDEPEVLRTSLPGAIAEVVARPRREAIALLRASPLALEVETFGERVHLRLASTAPDQEALEALRRDLAAAGVEVQSIGFVPPSLEDVFIAEVRQRPGRGASEVRP